MNPWLFNVQVMAAELVFMKNGSNLDFVLVEQHVGDAITDREFPSRLRTHQVSIDDLDFQKDVVSFLEEFHISFVVLDQGCG